jgi:hypothetical protein
MQHRRAKTLTSPVGINHHNVDPRVVTDRTSLNYTHDSVTFNRYDSWRTRRNVVYELSNISRLRVRQTATLFKKTHCWTNVR